MPKTLLVGGLLGVAALLGYPTPTGASDGAWPWVSFKVLIHESCKNLTGITAAEVAQEVRKKLNAVKSPLPPGGDRLGMLLMPRCLVEVDISGKKPPGHATIVVTRFILGDGRFGGTDANVLMEHDMTIREFQWTGPKEARDLIIYETAAFASGYTFAKSFEKRMSIFPSLFTDIGFDERTNPAAADEARRAEAEIRRRKGIKTED